MKKRTVKIEYLVTVEYDENSPEFIDSFKSYKQSIDSNADEDNMIFQVAWHVQKFGADALIEGVGYVKIDDTVVDEKLYSGITVHDDDPEADIEFYS